MTDPDLDQLVIAVARKLAGVPTTTRLEDTAGYDQRSRTDMESVPARDATTSNASSLPQKSVEPLSDELISAVAARLYSMLPGAAPGMGRNGDDLPFVEIEI